MKRPPIVAQSINMCGPASLKSVFMHHGFNASEKRIATWSQASRKYGTWSEGLILAARKAGFYAEIHDFQDTSSIGESLICGPAIVLWQYEGGDHYSVIWKATSRHVYMMEPANGTYTTVSLKEFGYNWWAYEDGDEIPGRESYVQGRLILVRPWHPGRIR